MSILITAIIVLIQFIAGQALGFGIAFGLGIGDGWELVVIPIGNALGVWGVGALAASVRQVYAARAYGMRLVATAVGAALGTIIILVTPATGFGQLLYPLLGALLGFYIAPRIFPRP